MLGKRDRLDRHMKILWLSCTDQGFCAVQDYNNLNDQKYIKMGQR